MFPSGYALSEFDCTVILRAYISPPRCLQWSLGVHFFLYLFFDIVVATIAAVTAWLLVHAAAANKKTTRYCQVAWINRVLDVLFCLPVVFVPF